MKAILLYQTDKINIALLKDGNYMIRW